MPEKVENIKYLLAHEIYEKFKQKMYMIEASYSIDNITDLQLRLLLAKYDIPIPHQLLLRF